MQFSLLSPYFLLHASALFSNIASNMSATLKSLKTVAFFYMTSRIFYMVTHVSKISATLGKRNFINNFDTQPGEPEMCIFILQVFFQYSLQQHVTVLLTQKRYYVFYGYVILRMQRIMPPFQFPSLLEYSATSIHEDKRPEPAVPTIEICSDSFSCSVASIQLSIPVLNSFVFIFFSLTARC